MVLSTRFQNSCVTGETFQMEKTLPWFGKDISAHSGPVCWKRHWEPLASGNLPETGLGDLHSLASSAAKQLCQFGGSHFIHVNLTFHISEMQASLLIRIPNVERVQHPPAPCAKPSRNVDLLKRDQTGY